MHFRCQNRRCFDMSFILSAISCAPSPRRPADAIMSFTYSAVKTNAGAPPAPLDDDASLGVESGVVGGGVNLGERGGRNVLLEMGGGGVTC